MNASHDGRRRLRDHIGVLAREHLERADRARLSLALDALAEMLDADAEELLLVTDGYLDPDWGLLAVTDRRAVFLDEADGAQRWIAMLDQIRAAHAVDGAELADVVVATVDSTVELVGVGDIAWARDVAAALEARFMPEADEFDIDCPRCGAAFATDLREHARCPSCGLGFAPAVQGDAIGDEPDTVPGPMLADDGTATCPYCAEQIQPAARLCPHCRSPLDAELAASFGPPPAVNGLAIAAFVLSLIWLWALGSVLAIVFGVVARRQIADRGERGDALAVAAIVLGVVGLGGLMVLLVAASSTPSAGY